jgi:hypothetical protein
MLRTIRSAGALFASVTAVTLIAGGAVAQARVTHIKPASTPSCGDTCNNVFNERFGPGWPQAAVPDFSNPFAADKGDAMILSQSSNTDPNQDFEATNVGTIDDFVDSGIIAKGSYVDIAYPDWFPVWENTFKPYGVDSGLCVGLAKNAFRNEKVTLQDCGDTARTLWVADLNNSDTDTTGPDPGDFNPWVAASDPNFSHALVLTENGWWGQLTVTELNTFSGGIHSDRQQWGINFGPENLTP